MRQLESTQQRRIRENSLTRVNVCYVYRKLFSPRLFSFFFAFFGLASLSYLVRASAHPGASACSPEAQRESLRRSIVGIPARYPLGISDIYYALGLLSIQPEQTACTRRDASACAKCTRLSDPANSRYQPFAIWPSPLAEVEKKDTCERK